MFTIAGIPVLNPDEDFSPESRDTLYSWALSNNSLHRLVQDLLRSNPRLETLAVRGHLLQEVFEAFPPIRVNELYWPVGANRFGCAYILLSEKAASLAFALSDRIDMFGGKTCSETNYCPLKEGQWMICPPDDEGTSEEQPQDFSAGFLDTMLRLFEDIWQENEIRPLNPIPVMIWNRDISEMPAAGTDFVRTAMYPLFYVPLTQFECFAMPDFDGVGILVLVDQRFFWRFITINNDYILPGDSANYFNWYKVIALALSQHLYSFQYAQPAVPTLAQTVWHDYINPNDLGEAPDTTDPIQTLIYKDDRAFMGPSGNVSSFGAKYTLSEFFSVIEKSLCKRMVFTYGWQISFRNSRDARLLWLRKLILFIPSLVYTNDQIFYEMCVPDKKYVPYREKPLYQGGIPFYWNRFKVNEEGLITGLNLKLDARLIMPLPERVRVFGDAYYTTSDKNDPDFGKDDWGLLAPFAVTLWSGRIVGSGSNIDVPLGEYPNPICSGGPPLLARARRFLQGPKQASEYHIYTTCTAYVKIRGGAPGTDDSEKGQGGGYQYLNKKRVETYAKNVVRNWLYWCMVPTPLQFQRIFKWTPSGFEDAVRYDGVRGYTSIIPFSQQNYLQTGVMYSGTAKPDNEGAAIGPHRLLSEAHTDTPIEVPTNNEIIVGRGQKSVLPVPQSVPDVDYYWHKLKPYEVDDIQPVQWSPDKRAVLMVVPGDPGLGFFGVPPSPDAVGAYIPNSYPTDCTVTWWPPVMMAFKGDPTMHFGGYKFEQSLRTYLQHGKIRLINDVENPGLDKAYKYTKEQGKHWGDVPSLNDVQFSPHKLLNGTIHVDTVAHDPTNNEIIIFDKDIRKWKALQPSVGYLQINENKKIVFAPMPTRYSLTSEGLYVKLVGDVPRGISDPRIFYYERKFTKMDNEIDPTNHPNDNPNIVNNPCTPQQAGASQNCINQRYVRCSNMATTYAIYPRETSGSTTGCPYCDSWPTCPIIVTLVPTESNTTRCVYKTAYHGCFYYGAPSPCANNTIFLAEMEVTASGVTVRIKRSNDGQVTTLTGSLPPNHTTTITLSGSGVAASAGCYGYNWVAEPWKCIPKKFHGYDICLGNTPCTNSDTMCISPHGTPTQAIDNPDCANNSELIMQKCKHSHGSYIINISNVGGGCSGGTYSPDPYAFDTKQRCQCSTLNSCNMAVFRWPCTCRYTSRFVYQDKEYGILNICGCTMAWIMNINNDQITLNLVALGSSGTNRLKYRVIATYQGSLPQTENAPITLGFVNSVMCTFPNQITLTRGGDKANVGGVIIDPFGSPHCGVTCGQAGGGGGQQIPGDGAFDPNLPGENNMTNNGVVVVTSSCPEDAGGGAGEVFNPKARYIAAWNLLEAPAPLIGGIVYQGVNGQEYGAIFATRRIPSLPDYYKSETEIATLIGSAQIRTVKMYIGGHTSELANNETARYVRLFRINCRGGIVGEIKPEHFSVAVQAALLSKSDANLSRYGKLWSYFAIDCNSVIPHISFAVARKGSTFAKPQITIPEQPQVGIDPGAIIPGPLRNVVFFMMQGSQEPATYCVQPGNVKKTTRVNSTIMDIVPLTAKARYSSTNQPDYRPGRDIGVTNNHYFITPLSFVETLAVCVLRQFTASDIINPVINLDVPFDALPNNCQGCMIQVNINAGNLGPGTIGFSDIIPSLCVSGYGFSTTIAAALNELAALGLFDVVNANTHPGTGIGYSYSINGGCNVSVCINELNQRTKLFVPNNNTKYLFAVRTTGAYGCGIMKDYELLRPATGLFTFE